MHLALFPAAPDTQGIISDLFPGVELPPSDYKLMTAAIEEASTAANLQPTPYFTLKVGRIPTIYPTKRHPACQVLAIFIPSWMVDSAEVPLPANGGRSFCHYDL